MSAKNTFIPLNWVIDDNKFVTCWVTSANATRAAKFKLVPTGKSNMGTGIGFGADKIKYFEFAFQIDNDAEIHKEQTGSTISWNFSVNGVNIVLTYRNQYSNSNYRGKTRSVENLDRLFTN